MPLALVVAGANRNDFKLTEATLGSIPDGCPRAPVDVEQNLCLDKGYDYDEVYALVREFGYIAHIRPRDEEAALIVRDANYKARRWVVERTHSWMNRFRRILVRWEKKAQNYLAMLHFACALITFKQAGLVG